MGKVNNSQIRKYEQFYKEQKTVRQERNLIPIKIIEAQSLTDEQSLMATDWPSFKYVVLVAAYEWR